MADWEFRTEAFRDEKEVLARNVNGIGGAALAEALRAHLGGLGFSCGEVVPEDFGCVFYAAGPEGRYLCAVSLEPDEGSTLVGHAGVTKHRSLGDRILGRNREAAKEAVPVAVESFLCGHPDLREVVDTSA